MYQVHALYMAAVMSVGGTFRSSPLSRYQDVCIFPSSLWMNVPIFLEAFADPFRFSKGALQKCAAKRAGGAWQSES